MPTQNDFSIKSYNKYLGNEQTNIITGNGITSFQDAALRSIESIVRNSGYPNYTLLPIDALTNSRVFYDADNDGVSPNPVAQTTPPSLSVLTQYLLQDGAYDTGSGPAITGAQADLINKMAPKVWTLFSKASAYLDSDAAETDCGTVDGSGRYQNQIGECIYDICVAIQ